VISTAESFLARMASANSVAGVKQRSVSFMVLPGAQIVPQTVVSSAYRSGSNSGY
jgi:hypothetical protein